MRSCPPLLGIALLAGALALDAGPARADIVPSGYKSVKSSIEVEAEVPKGHSLLLINTFEGATKLVPGETIEVAWHPLHGKMQVVSATTSQVAAIEAIAENHRGDERMPMMQAQSTPCAEPFDGVRTVKDTERYDEIRWHYDVSIDDKACKADLTRTAYLADGVALKTEPSAKRSADDSDGGAAPKAATTTSKPTKNAPATPASTCAMTGPANEPPGPAAAMMLFAGLAIAARARRRR